MAFMLHLLDKTAILRLIDALLKLWVWFKEILYTLYMMSMGQTTQGWSKQGSFDNLIAASRAIK